MSDRIFAAVFLLALAGLGWIGWKIEAPFTYEPIGPRAYPLLLIGAMAACAAWLLVKPDARGEWPESPGVRWRAGVLLVTVLAWVLAFQPLGFIVSTALASIAIARLFGATWGKSAAAGVVSAVALYLFFDKLLDVALPLGSLWGR